MVAAMKIVSYRGLSRASPDFLGQLARGALPGRAN
jgi:hypothetical protein